MIGIHTISETIELRCSCGWRRSFVIREGNTKDKLAHDNALDDHQMLHDKYENNICSRCLSQPVSGAKMGERKELLCGFCEDKEHELRNDSDG